MQADIKPKFRLLSTLLAISLTSTLTAHAVSPKKGIGESSQPGAMQTISDSNISWYYDWSPLPAAGVAPSGVQFVPMIWGINNLNKADLNAAKASGSDTLLGFNEPNEKTQSNMTVRQALDAWPQLEALNMRLGSPAPGTGDDVKPDGWLAQFMAGAKAAGYRVDFICIHPYQSSFDPDQATKDLIREVTTVHDMYHLQIWVTEYAMANWKTPPQTPDAATQTKFAAKSAQALEAIPFVERYAWYGDVPNQPTFSLYNTDGTPTPVGLAWKVAPESVEAHYFNKGLAMTPPMGWSSWNNYRTEVNEEDTRRTADAMVATGLKDAGYEYVDIDVGWFFNKRDADGNMIPDQKRFPSGMKALADYIHSKGLKAGIYTDVGEKGCGQGGSSPAYYDRDAKLFAEWGYDLVKVDSCGAPKDTATMRSLYGKFSEALRKAPRPMVFNICSQGEGEPWVWGPQTSNYWRVGHDVDYYNWINPEDNYLWEGVLYEFDSAAAHPGIAGPGHWNDPDMLPIGGVKDSPGKPQPGGRFLTSEEEKSVFSMWSTLAAPLILGADLVNIPPHTLEVALNREVIAVDQDPDGQQARLIDEQGPGLQVWERPLYSQQGERKAVLLLNRTWFAAKITYPPPAGAGYTVFHARDLWLHSDLGNSLKTYTATIPPHGVAMLLITPPNHQ
jgi:alpha-galactosidase